MAPIRLGIIGTGLAVEQLHWPALRQLSDRYVVTAFHDISRDNAERFASYSGLGMSGFCAERSDLLARDDVDAVLVCVPIPLLYPIVAEALAAGKDVMCEKPTGTDEKQAREFLELERSYPQRRLFVAENYFYRDDICHARKLIDEGAIGTVHLVSWRIAGQLQPREGTFSGTPWRHQPAYRGGIQLDAGVHNVAQIRMLGGDVTAVHAGVNWVNSTMNAPTEIVMNLRFSAGAIGNYVASYPEIPLPPEPNDMRVYGTEGTLILDGGEAERRVRVVPVKGAIHERAFVGIDNGYKNELTDFADALQDGTDAIGTVRQTFANMMVMLRALDSAESGQVCSLPADALTDGVPRWQGPR